MRNLVLSYSLSGNNEALAAGIAEALQATHIRIAESKTRKTGTIFFDVLFGKVPVVSPTINFEDYDLVILVGPVWIGHVATPFRSYLKQLNGVLNKYVYVSLCGGADGQNTKLVDELTERVGKEPLAVIEFPIGGLLPQELRSMEKDTQSYHPTETDIKHLTCEAVTRLREIIVK